MNKRVVVTGIGLVTAPGSDKDIFWDRIKNGRSGVELFDKKDNFCVRAGARVKDQIPEKFKDMDRAIQFALMAAYSAVRDSGLNIQDVDKRDVGLAVSTSKGNISIINKMRLACESQGNLLSALYQDPNIALCAEFGFCGPITNTISACATGAHSIIAGAQMIRRSEAKMVLAGAAEASITNLVLGGFKNMGVLAEGNGSADSIFRPFDKNRQGFVIGEGAGVVILESYETAARRGARIYGEVCGWANTGDAYCMTSFNPDAEGIARGVKTAMERSGLKRIDYINCHGTATLKNDTIETHAIKTAFGRGAYDIALSSTKPLTGHMLGAGGSVEFIISLLAMENNFVPPTINLDDSDPECDLDYTPRVGAQREINSVMSLSFGFGGHVGVLAAKKII